MAKISFSLEDFKSEFIGRVAESYIEARTGNDGQLNEVWRQVIVRQQMEDTGLMDIVLDQPECRVIQDGTCPYKALMHNHQSIWAQKWKGSPLHRFIEAMDKSVHLSINDPEMLKGHTFRWYQWDQPAWTGKDGTEHKSRPYFFIQGWPDDEAQSQPAVQPVTQEQMSQPAQIAQAPVNGSNGNQAFAPTQDAVDQMFAVYCDGKTDQEIKQGLIVKNEVPELTANPNFRVNIMNNAATKRLLETGLLTKDEAGTYHGVTV